MGDRPISPYATPIDGLRAHGLLHVAERVADETKIPLGTIRCYLDDEYRERRNHERKVRECTR